LHHRDAMLPTHQQGTDLEGRFALYAVYLRRVGRPTGALRTFQYYSALLVQDATSYISSAEAQPVVIGLPLTCQTPSPPCTTSTSLCRTLFFRYFKRIGDHFVLLLGVFICALIVPDIYHPAIGDQG
jgi:hypothetical protein